MMGIINNLLLGLVEREKGAEGREAVLAKAGMAGTVFRSEDVYAEEDFRKLFDATLDVLGIDSETAQKVFARYCGEVLLARFPMFWRTAGNARAMLTKVPKIHADVPGAASKLLHEKLLVGQNDAGDLVMLYDSPNKLCTLLVSMVEFVLDHYGEKAELVHEKCVHRGHKRCELAVRFASGTGKA